MDPETFRMLVCCRAQVSLEVASLTKIMTCFTVLELVKAQSLDIATLQHTVSTVSQRMSGTSAQIIEGEVYTIEQLLYALMLPSGNDAAVALAEWGGGVLRGVKSPSAGREQLQQNIKCFIKQMNATAQRLQMKSTKWANPHGLSNQNNKSTAYDMARLCSFAIRQPLFRKITSAKSYKTCVSTHQGKTYPVEWENTNKLLNKPGFFGIKTGITPTAGPCMASAYEHEGSCFVVILLRTNKASRRFRQTKLILYNVLRDMQSVGTSAEQEKRRELFQFYREHKEAEESEEDSAEEEFVFDGKESLSKIRRRERIIRRLFQ